MYIGMPMVGWDEAHSINSPNVLDHHLAGCVSSLTGAMVGELGRCWWYTRPTRTESPRKLGFALVLLFAVTTRE